MEFDTEDQVLFYCVFDYSYVVKSLSMCPRNDDVLDVSNLGSLDPPYSYSLVNSQLGHISWGSLFSSTIIGGILSHLLQEQGTLKPHNVSRL